MQPQSNTKY